MANNSTLQFSCTPEYKEPLCWLTNESLAEFILLDTTCDVTMQLSKNNPALPEGSLSTPISDRSVKTCVSPWSSSLHVPSSLDATSEMPNIHKKTMAPNPSVTNASPVKVCIAKQNYSQSHPNDPLKYETMSKVLSTECNNAPEKYLDDRYFPEITLLEVTQDVSTGTVLEDSQPSSDPSGQNDTILNASVVDTLNTHPADVTYDKSSSSETFVQRAAAEVSPPDVQFDKSPKHVTSVLLGEPMVTSNMESNNDSTNDDVDLPCKMPQQSQGNSTLTIVQQSILCASANVNGTSQIPCQNQTLDPPSNSKVLSDANEQATSVSENTETTVVYQKCSDGSCNVQNNTIEIHSFQRSADSSALLEAGAATSTLQNDTFDKYPSKQNGTISMSESSSSGSLSNTSDKPDPCILNATSSPVRESSEAQPPPDPSNHKGLTASSDPDTRLSDRREATFESSAAVEVSTSNHKASAASSDPETRLSDRSEATFESSTAVEVSTSNHKGSAASSDPDTRLSDRREATFESSAAVEVSTSNHKGSAASSDPDTRLLDRSEATFESSAAVEVSTSNHKGSAASSDPDTRLLDRREATFESSAAVEVSTSDHKASAASSDPDTLLSDRREATFESSAAVEVSTSDHKASAASSDPDTLLSDRREATFESSAAVEVSTSNHKGSAASSDPDTRLSDRREATFESSAAVAVGSADQCKVKDHCQSSLLVSDLSNSLCHQTMDMVAVNKNTFNLDDSLDLNTDALITSTPMTNCKMFNWTTGHEMGKDFRTQRKLSGDGQTSSDIPSADCVRHTLTQAKVLPPPPKAASKLLKYKPTTAPAGKFKLTSGPVMTRQTQANALRNNAASDAPCTTTGTSASRNLCTTAMGAKQPNPGWHRLQLSSKPSGIQSAGPGLKRQPTRSTMTASSSAKNLCETTGTNPEIKTSPVRKQPIVRSDSKNKKIDGALPSSDSEPSASSCGDAAVRAKSLKQPAVSQKPLPAKIQRPGAAVQASTAETSRLHNKVWAVKQPVASHRTQLPRPQGCTRCMMLEEKNRKLKEELLKYRKQEEDH